MKLVRALVAAAAVITAAAVLPTATSSPAGALQPTTNLCGWCWNVGNQ